MPVVKWVIKALGNQYLTFCFGNGGCYMQFQINLLSSLCLETQIIPRLILDTLKVEISLVYLSISNCPLHSILVLGGSCKINHVINKIRTHFIKYLGEELG